MFRFANPEYLYLLISIPVLIALFIWAIRKQRKNLILFGNPRLLGNLMPNVSYVRPQIKFYIMIIALTLIIIALARPQFGSKLATVKKQGIEAMIVLDVSNSMLAQDIQPNRLENAKMILSKLIDKMSDDKLGLIVFAGDAFIQIPITADYISAKMFLSSISPSLVARQGTAIGTSIDKAIHAFGAENQQIGRAIIIITDGENHEDDAIGAAKLALEKGINVHVIGMGKTEGSPIPIPGTLSFRKDKEGNVVVSKLNETMCKQIAEAGGGIYVHADNSNVAWKAIEKELNHMSKSDLETKVYSEYNERFFIFSWIALFLLLIEFHLLNRNNKSLNKFNFFDKEFFKRYKK